MPTFGNTDIIQDQSGNALANVPIQVYGSLSDAQNKTNLLGTSTTNNKGQWPITVNGMDQVWARDPAGNIWTVASDTVAADHAARLSALEGLTGTDGSLYAPITGSPNYAPASGSGVYESQTHASSTYETQSHAAATYDTLTHTAATYAPITGSTTYETQAHAAATYAPATGSTTYETQGHASSTYQTQSGLDAATGTNINVTSSSTQTAGDGRWIRKSVFPKIASAPSGGDDQATLTSESNAAAAAGLRYWLQAGLTYQVGSKWLVPCNLEGNSATVKRMSTYTTQDRTVGVELVNHITISNLNIDGNRSAFSGSNLMHGIGIYGCDDVRLVNVRSFNCYGDGFYTGYNSGAGQPHNTHLKMFDCIADNNYRNGLSVCDVTMFRAYGCTFSNTNGTSPQAGVDVEPATADANCRDVEFVGCDSYGNSGHGLTINLWTTPTGNQDDIRFDGCRSYSNTFSGLGIYIAYSVRVTDCTLSDNTSQGIEIGTTIKGLTVIGGALVRNGQRGFYYYGTTASKVRFIGTEIANNSTSADNTYDGVRLQATGDAFTFSECAFGNDGATGQRYGITTAASTITNLRLFNNRFYGNRTSQYLLSDDGATRRMRGNGGGADNQGGYVSQPAVAATGVNVTNTTGFDCMVYVAGGTVTAITVGNNVTGMTTGPIRVPAGQVINITYSVAPTWKWFAD